MDAGRLDDRIDILRSTVTADSFNSPIETWAILARVSVKATPLSDGEKWSAGQTLAQQTIRFVVRYSASAATVTPKDRISYRARTYDVLGVKRLARNDYLEITAAARAE